MKLREDPHVGWFEQYRDWIHHHSGIFLEHSKADALQLALEHRAGVRGTGDLAAYFSLLTGDEGEFKELMNLVTINETRFFRFPGQFDALRDIVVPEILAARADQDAAYSLVDPLPFRVWSAGCSTGEEPYTIAMTLLDSALDRQGVPIQVIGTDVSTRALDRATSAVYPTRALESVDQDLVARFFEPAEELGTEPGSAWRPAEAVRALCEFRYHNLIRDPFSPQPFSAFDVIFCRNVTIYFQLATTRRIISRFYDALNPGGYLFLGHSETLASVSDCFETVDANGVFLYRKPMEPSQPVASGRSRLASRRLNSRASRVSRTREVTSSALRPDAGDPESTRLADAFARADVGDLAGAAAEADEILAAHPLCAPARFLLGVCRRGQGDTDGALAEFRRTLYIDPQFCLAHFALAGLHQSRNEPAEAIREFERTLELLGKDAEGSWSVFLGGFSPEVIAHACERGIAESAKALRMPKEVARTGRY